MRRNFIIYIYEIAFLDEISDIIFVTSLISTSIIEQLHAKKKYFSW